MNHIPGNKTKQDAYLRVLDCSFGFAPEATETFLLEFHQQLYKLIGQVDEQIHALYARQAKEKEDIERNADGHFED